MCVIIFGIYVYELLQKIRRFLCLADTRSFGPVLFRHLSKLRLTLSEDRICNEKKGEGYNRK